MESQQSPLHHTTDAAVVRVTESVAWQRGGKTGEMVNTSDMLRSRGAGSDGLGHAGYDTAHLLESLALLAQTAGKRPTKCGNSALCCLRKSNLCGVDPP